MRVRGRRERGGDASRATKPSLTLGVCTSLGLSLHGLGGLSAALRLFLRVYYTCLNRETLSPRGERSDLGGFPRLVVSCSRLPLFIASLRSDRRQSAPLQSLL